MAHNINPITVIGDTDSTDQHWVVCADCGARWAGPLKERASADDCAAVMNRDPYFIPPLPQRQSPCCELVPAEPMVAADPRPHPESIPGALGAAHAVLGASWTLVLIGAALWATLKGLPALVRSIGPFLAVAAIVGILAAVPTGADVVTVLASAVLLFAAVFLFAALGGLAWRLIAGPPESTMLELEEDPTVIQGEPVWIRRRTDDGTEVMPRVVVAPPESD